MHASASLPAASAAPADCPTGLWQVLRRDWRRIAVSTWKEIGGDNLSLLAAGVAFYSFLAFVPLLASVVLIYGLVADPADATIHAQVLLALLPADAAQIITEQLDTLASASETKTAFGLIVAILLALYGAMRAATSIIGALNAAYDLPETRSFVRTTLLSFAFTAGTAVLAVIVILAIAAMSFVGTFIQLPPVSQSLVLVLPWVAIALVATVLIGLIYRYGPDRQDVPWRWLTPGAVVASAGLLLATLLFGTYVSQFGNYNATYGALGAVVSFLMWLYVSAFVVLVGAELNSEIEQQCHRLDGKDEA